MTIAQQTLVHPIRVDARGTARIGDTRVTLETVMHRFMIGDTAEEIADSFHLDLSDIYATITYYLQHRNEVDKYLRDAEEEEAHIMKMIDERSNPKAFRERLLKRLASQSRAG